MTTSVRQNGRLSASLHSCEIFWARWNFVISDVNRKRLRIGIELRNYQVTLLRVANRKDSVSRVRNCNNESGRLCERAAAIPE